MPLINSTFTSVVRNPQKAVLLDYLSRRFPYHTRESWSELIGQGRLALDGHPAAGDTVLREGQQLRFTVVDYEEPEVPTDFKVVAARGDLCLVHKPAGLPVHRTGKIFFQTLANLLRERLGDDAWAPLNRLDRETSGLMAFARGGEALRDLAPGSPFTAWTKLYAAVIPGELPTREGLFDWPLGEAGEGPIRSRMHADRAGANPQAVFARPPKSALTLFCTIAARGGFSLVALSPVTGRKHQLRAHLAEAGCPVVGDKIYSLAGRAYLKRIDNALDEGDYTELGARHHLLHAFHLRLDPSTEGRGSATEGPGDSALEGWDWDVGGEFTRYFPAAEIEAWSRTGAFIGMRRRIGELTGRARPEG